MGASTGRRVIDDRARVGVADANARPVQRRFTGGPQLLDTVVAKLCKFRNPPADVKTVGIERLALQDAVDDRNGGGPRSFQAHSVRGEGVDTDLVAIATAVLRADPRPARTPHGLRRIKELGVLNGVNADVEVGRSVRAAVFSPNSALGGDRGSLPDGKPVSTRWRPRSALKEIADAAGYRADLQDIVRQGEPHFRSAAARGIGLAEALPIFAEIRETTGLPVLTDVHEIDQCAQAAEVGRCAADPRLSLPPDRPVARRRADRPGVNVKKGQFLAPWDMKNVIAKAPRPAIPTSLACERGVSFGYNTLVSDMRALPILAEIGCPVVFDATHSVQQPGGQGAASGGERRFVPVLARAAVAVGVAGVFLETHPDPDHAPSDGPNMVPLAQLEPLLRELLELDAIAKRRVS